jgi:hypothetical protein
MKSELIKKQARTKMIQKQRIFDNLGGELIG